MRVLSAESRPVIAAASLGVLLAGAAGACAAFSSGGSGANADSGMSASDAQSPTGYSPACPPKGLTSCATPAGCAADFRTLSVSTSPSGAKYAAYGVTTDIDFIYVVEAYTADGSAPRADIVRIAKAAPSAVTTLATSEAEAGNVVRDESYVYWDSFDGQTTTIFRVAVDCGSNCAPTQIAEQVPGRLQVFGREAPGILFGASDIGNVYRIDTTSSTLVAKQLGTFAVDATAPTVAMAPGPGFVYAASSGTGAVTEYSLDGTSTSTLAVLADTSAVGISRIATECTTLFAVQSGSPAPIWAAPLKAPAFSVFASGTAGGVAVNAIAADVDYLWIGSAKGLYWLPIKPSLADASVTAEPPIGNDDILHVAVDDDGVYWTYGSQGLVKMLVK